MSDQPFLDPDTTLRVIALELATAQSLDVLGNAKKYYEFLKGDDGSD